MIRMYRIPPNLPELTAEQVAQALNLPSFDPIGYEVISPALFENDEVVQEAVIGDHFLCNADWPYEPDSSLAAYEVWPLKPMRMYAGRMEEYLNEKSRYEL